MFFCVYNCTLYVNVLFSIGQCICLYNCTKMLFCLVDNYWPVPKTSHSLNKSVDIGVRAELGNMA